MGSSVTVAGYGRGILRFFGNHPVFGQPRCGIELPGPGGNCDGTVGGVKYFACAPGHGVLVEPSSVAPCAAEVETEL